MLATTKECLDQFYEQVVELCSKSDRVTFVQRKDVQETLLELITRRLPVLEQWPQRILASEPGSPVHEALLDGWRCACMREPEQAWLTSILHPTATRHHQRAMKAWDSLCPPELALHLQALPVVEGQGARAWLQGQASVSRHVANFIAQEHPAWGPDRQTDWAIALITGIRPAAFLGSRNRAFAQLLTTLLPRLTSGHWDRIETLNLLPMWQKSWEKSGEVTAAWRKWQAKPMPLVTADRSRSRSRP